MLKPISFIITLLLTACVSYQPHPLPNALYKKSLKENQNLLISQAIKLHHPRLTPLKLDFRKPLTAQELGIIAVLMSPDLKALRAKEGVAKAQVFDAGLLPDPKLNLAFDKYLHQTIPPTYPISNALSASLGYDLAALIARQSKIDVAQKKYQQIHYDIAWQEWVNANQAELLAIRCYFLKQQINISKNTLKAAKKLLDLTHYNLQRHDLKIDKYALRKSNYLDLKDKVQTLEGQLKTTQFQLNQIVGIPPFEPVPLAPPKINKLPHFNLNLLYQSAFQWRLDLIALKAGYESQEATFHQAIINQFPSFVLQLTRAQDTGAINTFGPSISFELPIFNRNRGAIKIAKATREQLYQEYQARLFKTQSNIATLVSDLKRLDEAEYLLMHALPDLRQAIKLMYQGLKKGNITEIAYQDAQTGLFNKEITLLNLKQTKAEQLIALQIAIGRPWNEVIKHAKQ